MTHSPMRLLLSLVLSLALCLRAGWAFAEDNIADVLIVGAGLSGLSSAYYLKQAGKTAVILEAGPHIGGRVRTAAYAENLHAEVGLEEFWASNPALDIMRELHIPLETAYSSFSSFYFQGKLHAFTQDNNQAFLESVLDAGEMQAYRQWDGKMSELLKQLGQQRPLSSELLALKDVSFADWMSQHSGLPEKALELVRIQTEPEFGTPWTQISALDGIAEWRFFSGAGETPYHVAGGNQLAAEKIAEFLGQDTLRLNQLVTHITATDAGVEVRATDTGNFRQQLYRAKYVVTTAPLYKLNEIVFDPPLSAERKQAIQTQTGGSYFTVHILVDNHATHYWMQDGQSILPIITDSNLGVIYGGHSAPGQDAVLNLLINGPYADAYNARLTALDDIQKLLLDAFEKQWPGFRQAVKRMSFYRYHPRAIASWPVGRSRFDNLSDSLRRPQGRVYFAGDFTEDTHSNGAAQSAKRVVNDILPLLH